MPETVPSRRTFLKAAGLTAGAAGVLPQLSQGASAAVHAIAPTAPAAEFTLHIQSAPIEIGRGQIISATTYNSQFPGPLLRFREGRPVIVDVHNHTDAAEQLHWHGQTLPAEVDGAAEEGTPYIPANGHRRIAFTPGPAGFRFYHTHLRAGANLAQGMYGGEAGPVYIEPRREPGSYDREVFLVLKEFGPTFSRGGDMAQNFLSPPARIPALEDAGETAMRASLASGQPHGYEVGYQWFTINGRMLGHGEPVRVKSGERVLFHVLNASATEIRSLALPGHHFQVIALDGNPVPRPAMVPALWLGTGERVSALVTMDHPGVWILGDLDDDDRGHGMGIVIEYAGRGGQPQWQTQPTARWDYTSFAADSQEPPAPDATFDLTIRKQNAAVAGFNRWTINNVAFPMADGPASARYHLRRGRRYRLRLRNASDDIHPVHLHRHTFDLSRWGGRTTFGLRKDVLMLDGYHEIELDFVADNPGPTLFHCHQQLHMDFGLMTLFDYAG